MTDDLSIKHKENDSSIVVTVDDSANVPATTSDQNGDFLAMMERLAMSNIDVVKLEKMMDLHERMLDREAKKEFAADYVRMKPNLPKIIRMKDNTQTKSKYAPIEDINGQIDPILQQYGFGTSTKVISQTDKSVTVKAELWHRSGHIEENTITMPLDDKGMAGTVNKTMPHATSSSVTYAKRVAICALLNISTGDDKDGNTPSEPINWDQAKEIREGLKATGLDEKKFLKTLKVESVEEISTKDFGRAMSAIDAQRWRNSQKKAGVNANNP